MKNKTSRQGYIRDIAQTEKGPVEYTLTGNGPMILKIVATLSPKSIARQTFALFGTHDPNEAIKMLSKSELKEISLFYQKQVGSWAKGALNDMEHFTSESDLRSIQSPTLIIHSREDRAVSFEFAEYSHALIRGSELWEAPSWSHFISIGPGSEYVGQKVVAFLKSEF